MKGDEFGYSTFMSKGDRPRAVVSLGFMFHGLRVGLRTSSSKSSLDSRVWIFHLHVEGRSPASGGLTRFSCVMDCVCDCVHHPQSRVWIFHLHVEGRLPASGGLTLFRRLRSLFLVFNRFRLICSVEVTVVFVPATGRIRGHPYLLLHPYKEQPHADDLSLRLRRK
jgi:hypothetical protein